MMLGVFSDAHGNLAGFDKAYTALCAGGAEELWYLGDFVGYIPDVEVVARAMTLPLRALSGNHEEMLLSEVDTGEREATYRHAEARRRLTREQTDYLRGLSAQARSKYDGKRFVFVHGSPLDPVRDYVYPDSDLAPYGGIEADVVFMGHTHRPMDRRHDGCRFINVGSCGIPRDGSGFASACLYDTECDTLQFVGLDIAEDCRELMERHDLSEAVLKHFRVILERSVETP